MSDNPDRDALKEMLQSLEHVLSAVDAVSVATGDLLAAQKTNKPLALSILRHYQQQLTTLGEQRERMRELVAKWWTILEENPH